MTAIQLTGVEKVYKGRVHALRGVDLTVHPGEIFGLLGPNGAGKSTLVKILMTVIRPTKCEGTVLGRPVGHKPTLREIGYLPEHHQFPPYLTGSQVIDFFGSLSGVRRSDRRRRRGELLDLVGMTEWADKKVGSYSKGMRQRVGIAQSLVSDPKLIVLDEPTDGVDPSGRRDIRLILLRLREEGRAVFVNSHLLTELEMVCDRVAFMVQGQIRRQGPIKELTAGTGGFTITTAGDIPAGLVGTVEGVEAAATDARQIHIGTEQPEMVQPFIDRLRAAGVVIESVGQQRASLEDLFMRIVASDEAAGRPGARRGNGAKR